MTSSTKSRGTVAALTDQEWAFGRWSNPITAALTVYVLGVLLYGFGVGAGYVVIGGALFTLAFVGATLARHVRVLGIVYSPSLSLAITGWLAYAAGHETFTIFSWETTRHALVVLGLGAIPFTVVYAVLLHGRAEVRAAAEQERRYLIGQAKHWHEVCLNAGIRGWHLESIQETPGGQAITMRIDPKGTTYRQAIQRLEALELAVEAAYPGAVRIERGRNQSRAVILVNERNMLAEEVPMVAPTGPASILDPREIGVHEDRVPARITYAYRSSLSIGQREGGKTNYQNVQLCNLLPCVDTLLWVVDLKQGSVVKPYLAPYAAGHVDRPALDWVVTDIPGLNAMLDALDGIGNERAGRRVGDKHIPSAKDPAIRLVIDELADVLAGMGNLALAAKLVKVLRKHRSELIDVDLFTQRGTMSFLGPKARDIASQMAIVNTFKLDSPAEVFTTLGVTRDRVAGIDPSQFEYPGTMLTIAKGARIAPTKVVRIENDDIPAIAAANAVYRPQLNPVDTKAAGAAYARRWQTDTVRGLLADAASLVGGTYQPAHATTPPAAPQQPATNGGTAQVIPLHRTQSPTAPATSPTPAATPVIDLTSGVALIDQIAPQGLSTRDLLHQQYGPTEGERRYQLAQGAVALRNIKWILQSVDGGMLPTREVIDRMLARDPQRWKDLDARRLAALVAPYGVRPEQLGRDYNNNRGYTLTNVEEGLQNVTAPVGAGAGSGQP